MNYHFVAVEGNIGAGKTTLATRLAGHYGGKLILEEFAENTFLPKFYAEPARYAFPLELSFLADRYKQLREQLAGPDLFNRLIFSDYLFIKSRLFARINLPADEYALFSKLYNIIELQLPAPDLLIFLQSPLDYLQQNITARDRDYERGITADYLEKVSDTYVTYLKSYTGKLLIIDAPQYDFLRKEGDFSHLTSFLEKSGTPQVSYL